LLQANPESFITERFYSKEFTVQELSAEFMEKLRTIRPEADEKLGNAPMNQFMPDPGRLASMKMERANPD